MKKELGKESLESQYPSVDLAYEFVKPSYDWMVTRFEAANSKIQGLLTFSATITAALPIIAKAIFSDADFSSLWFCGAIIAFVLLVVTGIVGMRTGTIMLLHPKTLHDKYLHYPHWEFRQQVIYWAGEHFKANKKVINTKAWLRDVMIIFLLIEIFCFSLWIVI